MTDLVQKIADAVEKFAWEIPAPNQYTPQLIGIAQAARREAIRAALADAGEPVRYGCHIDLADDEQPDGCVLDEGRPQDCVYASKYGEEGRQKCGEWRPVKFTHPDSGRVAELEAQLAESARCAFEYAAKVGELERELAESREREGRIREALEKLQPLARRVLWMAFVWNDHNFTHPLDYARSEAKQQGFNCLEDAQEFLADLSKDMAFDFALKPQRAAGQEKNDE